MRWLVEPVRAALYSGLEWNVRLARADAPGVFARIHQTFESYWHTPAYEPYSLADRPRLDAALLEAKGYAHRAISRTAQHPIDQLNQQLVAAYAELRLGQSHTSAWSSTPWRIATVLRRAPPPGRRRDGHR